MRRASKALLGLVLGVLVLPGAFFASTFIGAHRTIARHLAESRAVLETVAPETAFRPAIFDPPEEGDAWELEVQFQTRNTALGGLAEDPPSIHRFSIFVASEEWRIEYSEGSVLCAEMEAHLDLLRGALRRSRLNPARRPGAFTYSMIRGEALDGLLHLAQGEAAAGRHEAAIERIVMALGWTQDLARFGDQEHRSLLWDAEVQGARIARLLLAGHRLSPSALARAGTWLERLRAARPPTALTTRIESAIERRFVADPDFLGAIHHNDALTPTRPTWKDLWSSTLHAAKRVTLLQAAERSLEGIDLLPSWERAAEAARRLAPFEGGPCQSWELPTADFYARDAAALTCFEILRVALAMARFEAERGAFPSSLDGLVPAYLPEVPRSPFCGRPYIYEPGRVRIDGVKFNSENRLPDASLDWRVRRAPPAPK